MAISWFLEAVSRLIFFLMRHLRPVRRARQRPTRRTARRVRRGPVRV